MNNGQAIEYKGTGDRWIAGKYVGPHPEDKDICVVLSEKGILLTKLNTGVRERKVKKEGWINIYPSGVHSASCSPVVYKSQVAALASKRPDLIVCIRIEWEE